MPKLDISGQKKPPTTSRIVPEHCKGAKSRIVLILSSTTVIYLLFILACISSRPGQSGRCDGYILEGKELDFYLKKLKTKKGK